MGERPGQGLTPPSPLSRPGEGGVDPTGEFDAHPGVTWRATSEKRDLARKFRRSPTEAERDAWELMRDRRLQGLKFRRQQVLEGYVADFYCAELRLVVEIDGGVHASDEVRAADEARTRDLEAAGYRVLRIGNALVTERNLCALVFPLARSGEGARG